MPFSERLLIKRMLSHRGIEFIPCWAGANMEDKISPEVMGIEVCVLYEEERHVVGTFCIVPRRHDKWNVLRGIEAFEVHLDVLDIDGIMPSLAVLTAANSVATPAFEQLPRDRRAPSSVDTTVVVPDQARKQFTFKRGNKCVR